jgi:hypothetical protein
MLMVDLHIACTDWKLSGKSDDAAALAFDIFGPHRTLSSKTSDKLFDITTSTTAQPTGDSTAN